MTPVEAGLLAQVVLAALAVAAALVVPGAHRGLVAGSLTAGLGAAGLMTGIVALAGGPGALVVPISLPPDIPLAEPMLAPDRLGGVFLAVSGAVGALAAVYGIGYARSGPAGSRTAWASFAVFLLGLQAVPAAADVVTFLLAWELMAIGSTVLVLTDHRVRPQVRSAALWYAVMTHLSFVLLVAGFAVLVAAAGSTSFAAMSTVPAASATGGLAFALLATGFATKAGLVPLHVWLPQAHPEAPSHVSAVMSAAMVKMGVYGLLLVVVRLMPGGPTWWGLALLAVGAVSAVYGILQASVASDLKRLLAYSTTENVGLMTLALGVFLVLSAAGLPAAAGVSLTAVLLLVVSHAAFKTVLFLGAGSVLHATGERDLDRLGGLQSVMPATSLAFGIAALGAAALPVTAGFAAEWVLLQSLVTGDARDDRLVAALLPATVAVVALTAGLALLTFVKAYGIAFLARPRTVAAAAAHEGTGTMRAAVLAGAGIIVALGLVPGPLAVILAHSVGVAGIESIGLGGVELAGVGALLDPAALLVLWLVLAVPVLVVSGIAARGRRRQSVDLGWGCGGVRVSPRMQYTATSYAEPLVRVFDDALRPTRDLEVSHAAESDYLVQRVRFRQRVGDVVEDRVYRPLVRLLGRVGVAARGLQNGSIHRYLAYASAALVVVLLAVTR